jgi:hypothetical protein
LDLAAANFEQGSSLRKKHFLPFFAGFRRTPKTGIFRGF